MANSDGIDKLPSGKWRVRHVGADGRRRTRTFTHKADALHWRAVEVRAVENGTWTPPEARQQAQTARGVTVAQWAEECVHERSTRSRRPIKATTADNYRKLARLTLNDSVLGAMPVTVVKRHDVDTWRRSLPAASRTQNGKAYEFLVSIFRDAVDAGLVEVTPCTLRGAGTPERAREPQTLSIAEAAAYLDAAPQKWRIPLLLSVTCGLRIGEVLGLRRRDLDLEAGTVTVRQTVAKVVEGDRRQLVLQTPKTAAANRTVHLLPHTLDEFRHWFAGLPPARKDALLFADEFGRPLNDDRLRRVHKEAAAAIGRPELRNHDLRATAATLAAQAGSTTREIQSLLGHTTATMALRYQTADAARDAARAAGLSAAWVEATTPE